MMKLNKPLVSVDWLQSNLENKNLIILDATIPKVAAKNDGASVDEKQQIKGAIFFDIKKVFSNVNAPFPNTILSPKEFEEKAQELGINNDSCIVVYDDLGIYSSPRVWWMFNLMGFTNIAILNGGFPEWKVKSYPIEKPENHQLNKGNFKVNYQSGKLKFTKDILASINNEHVLVADARSKGRFYATEPEPREDVKGGHIPNSVSFPFSTIIENGKFKSEENLMEIFNQINPQKKDFIFSCGTGITASVLVLGAELSGIKNHAVYDGSWTEWGITEGLPIEK
jgi:thiosulfate/3-mercaptopyruvate sulfurtransferase